MARCDDETKEALATAIEVQIKLVDLAHERVQDGGGGVWGEGTREAEYQRAVKKLKELQARMLEFGGIEQPSQVEKTVPTESRDNLIRDHAGMWVGRLIRRDGKVVVLDRFGHPLGSFNPQANLTHDAEGHLLGHGNLLTTLLPTAVV